MSNDNPVGAVHNRVVHDLRPIHRPMLAEIAGEIFIIHNGWTVIDITAVNQDCFRR
ncbi:hypothetical protein D3C85_1014420 [compost metagenome]